MKIIDKLIDAVVIATVIAILFTVGEVAVVASFLYSVGEDIPLTANMLAGTIMFNYLLAAIALIGQKSQECQDWLREKKERGLT